MEWKSCGKNMSPRDDFNNEHLEYYKYLKNRPKLGKLFRHWMFRPSIKEFEGCVLDVGCGIGEFLTMYQDSVGIDINSFCVRHCKREGLIAVVGDIHNIPFDNNEFNGVFCSNVLEHLDKEVEAVIEMHRVLKKNGKIVIHVPLRKGYATDPTHKRFYDEWDLRQLLQNNGFTNVKHFYMPVNIKSISGKFNFGELVMVGVCNKEEL